MVYRFFDEKASGSDIKDENMSDQQWAKELLKPIIKNSRKKKYNHIL